MKQFLTILILAIGMQTFSQEISFSAGSNNTEFTIDDNDSFKANGIGSHFAIEYAMPIFFNLERVSYSLGLNLNEYNAMTGDLNNLYEWQTTHLGLKNGLNVRFIDVFDIVSFNGSASLNLSHILNGYQKINTQVFDISNHPEFRGLTLWSELGVSAKFNFNEDVKLSVGYSVSEDYSFTSTRGAVFYDGTTDENVKMKNCRFTLSLIYLLND